MEQQELIDSGVASIAGSLGLSSAEPDESGGYTPPTINDATEGQGAQQENAAPPVEGEQPTAEGAEGEEGAPPTPLAAEPPKSWAKDTHALWSTIPPDAQKQILAREQQMLSGLAQYREHHEIGKSLNEVLSPYRPMIQAAGLDDTKAVAALLNAHYRLTQGPPEQRRAVYEQLGRDLGFQPEHAQQAQETPVDREARERLQRIENAITQTQRREYERVRQSVTQEFESFAKDKPYIDEVAGEIVTFLNAGDNLQTAYDKAIYANPVTRAKELSRLQKEAEDKLRGKAKVEVGKARLATAANVKGRDTARTPTESRGKLLDEGQMLNDLREIQSRTH